MSVGLLEELPTAPNSATDPPINVAGRQLRNHMAAVRVSFTWFGIQKGLTADQKAAAAEQFDAEHDVISASKKLLDTRHPAFRAVNAVRTKIIAFWKKTTLPFPEPGIRLIRRDDLEDFGHVLDEYCDNLAEAVAALDLHYGELRISAARRLGALFNPADYPERLSGLFRFDWDFPSVDPPEYLMRLSPRLYAEECRRITARFEEAVRLTEQAFTEEFARAVSHLCERLSSPEGEKKIFRDTAVENLQEFIGRFRHLSIGSNVDLDRLVTEAQQIIGDVQPKNLRDQESLRRHVASELSRVQASLDGMLVDRPRRRIIRDLPIEPAT